MNPEDIEYVKKVSTSIERKIRMIEMSKKNDIISWKYENPHFLCNHKILDSRFDGSWKQEIIRTLYTAMLKASNNIAEACLIGAGNFVLASPAVVSLLECLDIFRISNDTETDSLFIGMGDIVKKRGRIGRFEVYLDVFTENDYAVVGYKHQSDIEMSTDELRYRYINISGIEDSSSLNQGTKDCEKDCEKDLKPEENYVSFLIIFYIDISIYSTVLFEKYIKKLKKDLKALNLPEHVKFMFIPSNENKVERVIIDI